MFFFVIGLLMVAGNLLGIGPTANWSWELNGDLWKLCLPFVIACVWWGWADSSGLTKRRETRKDEQRKIDRRDRNIEAMGLTRFHKPRKGRD